MKEYLKYRISIRGKFLSEGLHTYFYHWCGRLRIEVFNKIQGS